FAMQAVDLPDPNGPRMPQTSASEATKAEQTGPGVCQSNLIIGGPTIACACLIGSPARWSPLRLRVRSRQQRSRWDLAAASAGFSWRYRRSVARAVPDERPAYGLGCAPAP